MEKHNVQVRFRKNITSLFSSLSELTLGPFTKDVRLTPGRRGLRNPDVQLLFECDSIVLSGRRGKGGLEILVSAGRPL